MKIYLIFAVLIVFVSSQTIFERVMLDDPQALCLDGSKGSYYIQSGDPAKVLLFFEGGGWCGDQDLQSTLENCYQRSKTDLGSSTNYPPTATLTEGIFSSQQENYFKNWTKVFLKYCDGSGHQGTRSQPILYKGAQVFFRGQNVTLAQFASVNKRLGIFQGKITHLVLTGQSAGGLAAFHWTNYVQRRVINPTKLWSIPDSGIFLDFENMNTKTNSYRISFQNLLRFSNEQMGTPILECNFENKESLQNCMFAQNIIQYIETPIFAPQSLYDTWSLYYILGVRCITESKSISSCSPTEKDIIEQYHRSTLNTLLKITNDNQNAAWAPVCLNHCYLSNLYYSSPNYRIPSQSQYSLIKSVADWIEGTSTNPRHIDLGDWPSNLPCSGLPQ